MSLSLPYLKGITMTTPTTTLTPTAEAFIAVTRAFVAHLAALAAEGRRMAAEGDHIGAHAMLHRIEAEESAVADALDPTDGEGLDHVRYSDSIGGMFSALVPIMSDLAEDVDG